MNDKIFQGNNESINNKNINHSNKKGEADTIIVNRKVIKININKKKRLIIFFTMYFLFILKGWFSTVGSVT